MTQTEQVLLVLASRSGVVLSNNRCGWWVGWLSHGWKWSGVVPGPVENVVLSVLSSSNISSLSSCEGFFNSLIISSVSKNSGSIILNPWVSALVVN